MYAWVGKFWLKMEFSGMDFAGTEHCILDANGRLKLSPAAIASFERSGGRELVMHCWPEGCLGLVPKSTWERMYYEQGYAGSAMLSTFAGRQKQRLFNRFTQYDVITAQGRITIPTAFRQRVSLQPGQPVVVSGSGECLEVWNPERFAAINTELDEAERLELGAARETNKDLPDDLK
jgi:DNA-binding transcriptional regulator/RsmH inhibitor MraZ